MTVQMAVATGFFSSTTLRSIRAAAVARGTSCTDTTDGWPSFACSGRMQVGNVTIDTKMSIAKITESAAVHSEAFEAVGPLCAHSRRGSPLLSLGLCPQSPDRVMSLRVPGRHGRMLERGDPAYALRVWKEQARQGFRRCFAACNCLRAMLNSSTSQASTQVALGTAGSVSVVVSKNPQHAVSTGRPGREQRLMTAAITRRHRRVGGFVGSEP